MKKLMLTGFGPFLSHDKNPSQEIVKKFNNQLIGDFEIFSWVFNVSYKEVYDLVPALLDEIKPDIIINLGLSSKRHAITPEVVALNYIDSKESDNEGEVIQGSKVIDGGANAYFSKINWDKALKVLSENEIPSKISTNAGTYVCNQTSYLFNFEIEKRKLNIKQGFIHIPNTLNFKVLEKSIELIIKNIQA